MYGSRSEIGSPLLVLPPSSACVCWPPGVLISPLVAKYHYGAYKVAPKSGDLLLVLSRVCGPVPHLAPESVDPRISRPPNP